MRFGAIKDYASAWIGKLIQTVEAVGFTIAGGTTPKTLTVSDTITLALGAANLRWFMDAAGGAPEWAVGIKMGTFDRDTSLDTGTQAITNVGFKPSNIFFLSCVPDTSQLSLGFDNMTLSSSVTNLNVDLAGSWGVVPNSIYLRQTSAINYKANISAFGADGFTVSWIKTGAKTGTATTYFLAFR